MLFRDMEEISENVSYLDLGDGHECVHMSKFFELYTEVCAFYCKHLNKKTSVHVKMVVVLYVNYSSRS